MLTVLSPIVRGSTSNVLRLAFAAGSSQPLTGLNPLQSNGFTLSAVADVEATTTSYVCGPTAGFQTIATLGVYAAPDAGKARLKELDSTHHPGVYELQLDDARFAVTGSKHLLISLKGNNVPNDFLVPLLDPPA